MTYRFALGVGLAGVLTSYSALLDRVVRESLLISDHDATQDRLAEHSRVQDELLLAIRAEGDDTACEYCDEGEAQGEVHTCRCGVTQLCEGCAAAEVCCPLSDREHMIIATSLTAQGCR